MTTHVPMARVPFAPLDNPRLQHLASAKNRQNGMIAQKSTLIGKANVTSSKSVLSPGKRPLEASTFDDFDSENVDPAVFSSPSKKNKSDTFEKPIKPFTFSLSTTKSMPPPPTVPSRLTTPVRANMSSPRTPLTAPAGRSPKRKAAGILKNRRTSAPFTRIDPPFASLGSSSTLPFSLDAALSGTFSSSAPKEDAGATIQESMPKNWFFEIYEDSPEEEASNLMEHSTLTLDLSSDEESSKKMKDDRGKENTPPDDYDASTASRSVVEGIVAAPRHVKKTDIVRRKVVTDDMDDGQRSPLSDLETDPFVPEGLDKDAHVIVDATPETAAPASTRLEVKDLFAAPVPFTAGTPKTSSQKSSGLYDMPVVDAEGDVKGDVIVWEDSPVSERDAASEISSVGVQASKEVEVYDENAAPVVDEVA